MQACVAGEIMSVTAKFLIICYISWKNIIKLCQVCGFDCSIRIMKLDTAFMFALFW